MIGFLQNTLALALDSAPWLLFGLLAAGLIKAWLPMDLVGRSLGGSGVSHVVRAALIGAPLPLCSCGTLPAAFALRRAGASKASTTSFLISTPETGVDSVALSWVLLGPFLALLRPIAAVISAVAAGLLVGLTDKEKSVPAEVQETIVSCDSGRCCSGESVDTSASTVKLGFWERNIEGIRYAMTDLLDDLAFWLAVGILAAGLVVTLVPQDTLVAWGSGLPAMLLMMLISVPMYVCATASTPLAHAMLFAGVSPGTVLVFLLAGPASNLAGLALVNRELGKRTLIAYLVGVGGISVLLGLMLDTAIVAFSIDALAGMAQGDENQHELPILVSVVSLLLLVLLGIKPLRRYLIPGKTEHDGSCCS